MRSLESKISSLAVSHHVVQYPLWTMGIFPKVYLWVQYELNQNRCNVFFKLFRIILMFIWEKNTRLTFKNKDYKKKIIPTRH